MRRDLTGMTRSRELAEANMALTTRRQLFQQSVFFTVIAFALFLVLPVGARGQDNSAAEKPTL
jgi:hypothetical protein